MYVSARLPQSSDAITDWFNARYYSWLLFFHSGCFWYFGYRQKNPDRHPQNLDNALLTIGMASGIVAKMVVVQFVGGDRQALRRQFDLSVSVQKLRRAFAWLSVNSWPFMEVTKDHVLWQTGVLAPSLESLQEA